jgi:hypothetical protein
VSNITYIVNTPAVCTQAAVLLTLVRVLYQIYDQQFRQIWMTINCFTKKWNERFHMGLEKGKLHQESAKITMCQ